MHASGICMGTIQARTHVQVAFACQQSMIRAQHRVRLSMQHECGESGNLGNECSPWHFGSSVATVSPHVGFNTI